MANTKVSAGTLAGIARLDAVGRKNNLLIADVHVRTVFGLSSKSEAGGVFRSRS